MSQKLTPCLWFDREGEDAAKFYTSIFPNSEIGAVSYYGDGMPLPKGTALTVSFTLDGKDFMALNGGPMFKFTEAVSFVVDCKDQKEVDYILGKTFRRRSEKPVRLAQRQVRVVVADRAVGVAQTDAGQELGARHAGADADDQARYPEAERRARRLKMKYLCLVYGEENKIAAMDDHECLAYDAGVRKSGHCVASEALEPVATATTVRVRNGKLSVSDGPFAETKEQLAGFYLIEARDLNEAIQLAAKVPPAKVGSIEVRPIRPIREAPRSGSQHAA